MVAKGDKTAADAARLFKVHPTTVSRLMAHGSGRGITIQQAGHPRQIECKVTRSPTFHSILTYPRYHRNPAKRSPPMIRRLLSLLFAALTMQAATDAPFYRPIRDNDLPRLRSIIKEAGADVRDARGSSALMYAAAIGSLDAMKLLVDDGAKVDAPNSFGATPLMWCAGDLAKVRYLLEKGASVTTKSQYGRTPLLIAATYDGSVEIGRLMIAKGADVRAKDQSGATVLNAAAAANNIKLARLLLDKGADVNSMDGAGFNPLMIAAANGDRSAPLVKLLIERGAAVNGACIDSVEMMKNGPIGIGKLTALLVAAGQGSYQTVESLLKAGANVNATDIRGMTPLMLAITTDHPDARIVRLLLEKGADRNLKSLKAETALDWAKKYQNPEIMRALDLTPSKPAEPQTSSAPLATATAAMEKGVSLMQRVSSRFLEKGGCPACHSQHHTGLAVTAAKASHVKVDWTQEQAEAAMTVTLRGALEQTLFQVVDPPPGTDGHVFSMLQIEGANLQPRLSTDAMIFHLAAMQRKEGDWPAYGVVRPPMEDGGFTVTAKAIRVLRQNLIPGRKAELEERIERAATWLANQTPVTTEDRSMQILGVQWAGRKASQDVVRQLIGLQRASGGWSQTEQLPADAYATGEVLYALHEAGVATTDPAYKRGVEFLLRSQKPDGSWHVKTRAAAFQPYFESGFPHGHDQWISQSGTAWAVMALSFASR